MLPVTLIEKLKQRKVIPFVGAGVSMNVKDKAGNKLFPSWWELLQRAIEKLREIDNEDDAELVKALINRKTPKYLEAAKYAREGLGNKWNDFLYKEIDLSRDKANEESLELARLVWELGSSLIVTTNYDKVLHWAKADVSTWDIESKFKQGKLLSEGLPNEPTVWHLHGYIDNPSDIILAPDGYQKLYPNDDNKTENKYKTALTTLRSLLTSYTFLFIGFSMDDTEFTNQLKEINDLFDSATGDHFVLIREAEKENVKKLNLPVEIITYENHGEPLLEKLRAVVEIANEAKSPIDLLPQIADYSPDKPAFNVPFVSKGQNVIGREENLAKVRESILGGNSTRIGQAVSFEGLGGLGKTQLAVEYAYEYKDKYPNGVIWITIDQDIDKQLVELAEKSKWIAPKSEAKDKLDIALYRLRTINNCLFVFDNIESLNQIEKYLPELKDNIHLLATSRNELGIFSTVSLDLLSTEQAIQMLVNESGRNLKIEEEITAKQIAENLGGLPLALELAGAYLLNRADVSWQDYLDLLQANPKSAFLRKFQERSFTKHDADVYRTLKISEELLSEAEFLEEILDILTWSGTSPMSVSLICHLLGIENETQITGALSLGVKLRFFQKSPDKKSYAIHRLVAQVRREDIPLDSRTEWVSNITQKLGDWFQDRREDFNELINYEREIEHLTAWQEHSLRFAFEEASRLLWLQAYPSYHRGRWLEAKEIVESALKTYKQTQCEDELLYAHLLNDFAGVSHDLGDYQTAFDYTNQAIAIRERLLGENHLDTISSYNNLGNLYGAIGNYIKQLEYSEKFLDIVEDNPNLPRLSSYYSNLAGAYGNLGDYDNYLKYAQISLDIWAYLR